ncbi:hypothetical protein PRK78_002205 [Emydomyces testavorans]|uniref:non-specific serine/threonine protein kinase n=1 Tax=Emydomyces testavorans TaxID=2070801 RepID=A0AAF0DDV8_9EURO|nr:hypothetical protein PRK78_002205 [Emydomyces testavorans]
MAFDKFFFGFDDDVEDVGKYKPGGYHPVHLGDILPKKSTSSREPRYRIIQKLGHGVFGTVWLARDLLGSLGYVAVKINVSRITGKSNETRILRWLRDSNHHGQPGYDNIVGLLDDFTIRGPNGTHECLVTEVVARLRDLVDDATFPTYTREISFQVLSGLAYLHNQGVTHGDFHFGNIGICIPQLQELSEEQLLDFLMNQTSTAITPVIPRDPLDQSQSLPAYVIPFINLVTFLKFSLGTSARFAPIRVKILDFGNGEPDHHESI